MKHRIFAATLYVSLVPTSATVMLCYHCLQLMPVLLDACGSPHSDLRQCAVYGVGVGASQSPELFKQHAPAALAAITAIITAPVSGW